MLIKITFSFEFNIFSYMKLGKSWINIKISFKGSK